MIKVSNTNIYGVNISFDARIKVWKFDLILIFDFWCFNATFSYIMTTSFSGGRSRSTRREPPTMGKQLENFYHLRLRVECTLFCNLQSQARTHAVFVIGLYELLGNPTT